MLLGVVKAGGAYVPLDGKYPEQRLRYMVKDAGAGVVGGEVETGESWRGWREVWSWRRSGRKCGGAERDREVEISGENLAYSEYVGIDGRAEGSGDYAR